VVILKIQLQVIAVVPVVAAVILVHLVLELLGKDMLEALELGAVLLIPQVAAAVLVQYEQPQIPLQAGRVVLVFLPLLLEQLLITLAVVAAVVMLVHRFQVVLVGWVVVVEAADLELTPLELEHLILVVVVAVLVRVVVNRLLVVVVRGLLLFRLQ
jgi:hypothetical protein